VRGWRLCDLRGLERLVRARAAAAGDGDLTGAAVATIRDYPLCEATTGAARPGWPDRLRRWLDGEPQPGPDHGEPGPGQAEAERAEEAYWSGAEALAMAGTCANRLGRAVADLAAAAALPGVPASMGDEAAGIAALVNRKLGPDLRKVRDVAGLAVILPTAQRFTEVSQDLAARMRARSAAVLAAEHDRQYETQMQQETQRRLALHQAAQQAAIGASVPRPLPAGPGYIEPLRPSRRRALAAAVNAGRAAQPQQHATFGTVLYLGGTRVGQPAIISAARTPAPGGRTARRQRKAARTRDAERVIEPTRAFRPW
jgi:hypothetical protein